MLEVGWTGSLFLTAVVLFAATVYMDPLGKKELTTKKLLKHFDAIKTGETVRCRV